MKLGFLLMAVMLEAASAATVDQRVMANVTLMVIIVIVLIILLAVLLIVRRVYRSRKER